MNRVQHFCNLNPIDTTDGNFEIEVEGTDSILSVKQKIEAVKPDYVAEGQKLICAGSYSLIARIHVCW